MTRSDPDGDIISVVTASASMDGAGSRRSTLNRFGEPFVIDRVDLLMLSVKAPLTDAVRATVCHRWREAADLWLDAYREPPYRTLSAWCGLEAALKAGLYDLAQYFYIKSNEAPCLPDFLAEAWRESLPIKRSRTRYYASLIHASQMQPSSRSPADARGATQRLVNFRLYREAMREIFRQRLYWTNPSAAIPLLAACYFALGEHDALIALHGLRRWYFGDSDTRSMLKNAQACLSRAECGAVENLREFTKSHPAGTLLNALLQAHEPVSSLHE